MEQNEVAVKLINKVKNLGYSPEVQEQITNARQQGLIEFTAGEIRTFRGPNNEITSQVEYVLNFAPPERTRDNAINTDQVYLQSVDALLTKEVVVPHQRIDGISTLEIEKVLRENSLPNGSANLSPDHLKNLQEQMSWAMEKAPQTFAALLVKYNPTIEFSVPDNIIKMAQEVQANTSRFNLYSSYFNLTALEIANSLHGRHVRKTLFKTGGAETDSLSAKPNNQEKERFTSWLEFDFKANRRPDGACPVNFMGDFSLRDVLREFNFKELGNAYDKGRVIEFMEKGSLLLLTNQNTKGEPEILAQANGHYKGLDFFKLDGEPVKNHRTYLIERHVEVGAYVQLKKGPANEPVQEQKKTVESKQQQQERFNNFKRQAIEAGQKSSNTAIDKGAHRDTSQGSQQNHVQSNKKPRTVRAEGTRRGQKR